MSEHRENEIYNITLGASHRGLGNYSSAGLNNPLTYIMHRIDFHPIKDDFEKRLNPSAGVIKATVAL